MKPKSSTVFIDGPSGQLALRVWRAPVEKVEKAVSVEEATVKECNAKEPTTPAQPPDLVIISHPHPEFGGTMDNKVVTTLERAFQGLGLSTVTYNFRGVGTSEGVYDGGVGEQLDLKAVFDWASAHLDFNKRVLAGFSFGAYVTLCAQPYLKADRILVVAPPVGLYDFSVIEPLTVPWDLIVGLEDEVVNVPEILDWAMLNPLKPGVYGRSSASHFFHGQLIWLKKMITSLY